MRQDVRPFLLACVVGLASAIFPSADDIQHGNLARIGDFLATLVASPPAEMHLVLDDKQEIHTQGHVAVISNMPYIGLHFQVGDTAAFEDGLLDVLLFTDLSKLELLGYAAQKVVGGGLEDPRIQHFQARTVDMDTQPAMPVMADGLAAGGRAAAHQCTTACPGGDGRQFSVKRVAGPGKIGAS